ncbi:polynucleotide 5'-hydroxyl-kinase NOL9 isoform X1 [Periplaneta americana]|uniref:polynucleotide 5'-hydroxyl-kinase NOL9 isoform X1 n=1 Tax=Periplaneta americana TaxID=6978 RepID=UPI0037E994E6
MDKFNSAHCPEKRYWSAVSGEIKKQRPKTFQKKLKKILHEAGIVSSTEATKVTKPQARLSFDKSSKKIQHVVEVEVSDKTDSLLSRAKKRRRKSRKGLNFGSYAGKKNEPKDYSSEKNTAHKTEKERIEAEEFVAEDVYEKNNIFSPQKKEDKVRNKSLISKDFCVSPAQIVDLEETKTKPCIDTCDRDEQENNFSVGKDCDFALKKLVKRRRKKSSAIVNKFDRSNDITTKNCEYDSQGNEERVLDISEYSYHWFSDRDLNDEQNQSGKRKRKCNNNPSGKKNVKDEQSKEVPEKALVTIEMDPASNYIRTPALLQNANNDKEDTMEKEMREFYRSLETVEISTTPETVTSTSMKENKTSSLSRTDETKSSTSSHSELDTSLQTDKSYCTSDIDIEVSSVYSSEVETCSGGFKIEKIRDKTSSIVVHKLPHREQFLLLMKHPNTMFFKGKLTISVLMGAVEILGCVMSKEANSKQTVYSPRGSSMLSIETCLSSPPNSLDYEAMNETLVQFGIELSKDIIADVEERDCVVLLEVPPVSPLENFLKTLPSDMQLFKFSHRGERYTRNRDSNPLYEVEEGLDCLLKLSNTARRLKRYQKGLEWYPVSYAISRGPVCTVMCGGKGVGKSTFLRFLVNQCLPHFGEVLCLDFDPGQPEFNVPGCVSAVVLKEPLLGPNFTHLVIPERVVNVGEVNISQCPLQYVKSVQHIISFCNSRPELMRLPCIVNTMGFNKGLGVDLTVSIIRLLRPHHVVQIQSSKADLNFPDLLHPSFVNSFQSRFCKRSEPLDYVLHTMNTMADDKKISPWGMSAPHLREAMILSYLSQMLRPPNFSLIDLVPYTTLFSKVILCVCHAKVPYSQILSAMNGNLVALCSYDGKDVLLPDDPELPLVLGHQPVCPCLGFGIVRGIDMEKKHLCLLTPLEESLLSQVNCLMLGAVTLPSCVYNSTDQCEGQVPYMATGPGQPTSKVARRFFRPLQHKRAHMKKSRFCK